jgi:outer membrane protein assembly factor BamE (lipoprotein component of BamABCDE complex)
MKNKQFNKVNIILFLLLLNVFSIPKITFAIDNQPKDKQAAIRMGLIFKGMNKKEVFEAQGYPAATFKHNIYDVWYYPSMYNAITGAKKFMDEVSIFFDDGRVMKIKSGTYVPNMPEEI